MSKFIENSINFYYLCHLYYLIDLHTFLCFESYELAICIMDINLRRSMKLELHQFYTFLNCESFFLCMKFWLIEN